MAKKKAAPASAKASAHPAHLHPEASASSIKALLSKKGIKREPVDDASQPAKKASSTRETKEKSEAPQATTAKPSPPERTWEEMEKEARGLLAMAVKKRDELKAEAEAKKNAGTAKAEKKAEGPTGGRPVAKRLRAKSPAEGPKKGETNTEVPGDAKPSDVDKGGDDAKPATDVLGKGSDEQGISGDNVGSTGGGLGSNDGGKDGKIGETPATDGDQASSDAVTVDNVGVVRATATIPLPDGIRPPKFANKAERKNEWERFLRSMVPTKKRAEKTDK